MSDVTTDLVLTVNVYNDRIPIFRSVIAKLYQEHKRAGFKIRFLTGQEEEEFEDFVTQVLNNYREDIVP